MKKFYPLVTLFTLAILPAFAQPLTLTYGQTPTQLVNNVVLGPGIISSNISGSLGSLSAASFTNTGLQGINLTGGLILSTGELSNINGVSGIFNSTNVGLAGDPDLNAIVNPLMTYDAQVLVFDFKASSDSVEFNFVFGSEEYNEYVNTSFNDVFGFFITGPGFAPNTNVALIPGTTTPVSINNVNNGNSGGVSTGPCMNCNYFVDNVNSAVPYSMDGFTTTIKLKFPVTTCADYTFKIAIADVGDGIFDSHVLIEENSFIPCPLMQPVQNSMPAPSTVSLCTGGVVILTAPPATSYLWSTGETTQSIVVTQPGTYNYVVNGSTCTALSSNVNVVQQGTVQPPVIVQQGPSITSAVTGTVTTYQWYLDDVIIQGANLATYDFTTNGCYKLAIYTQSGCEAISNNVCITNVGIPEIEFNEILVSPNPVYTSAEITSPFERGSVTTLNLYDISGRLVMQEVITDNGKIILEKGLINDGVYFIRLTNSNSSASYRGKIIFN